MVASKRTLKNSKGDIYVTVYFDEEIQATTDVWTGPFENPENFYAGLKLVLENIIAFGSKKWLADISNIEGDFHFARDYIAKQFVPETMRYGLECEALVVPNTIIPMVTVQDAIYRIENFEIRIFGSVDEAVAWLGTR